VVTIDPFGAGVPELDNRYSILIILAVLSNVKREARKGVLVQQDFTNRGRSCFREEGKSHESRHLSGSDGYETCRGRWVKRGP